MVYQFSHFFPFLNRLIKVLFELNEIGLDPVNRFDLKLLQFLFVFLFQELLRLFIVKLCESYPEEFSEVMLQ
jgi:hypothetical protein